MKVYIEIGDLSSFIHSHCSSYSIIEQTALKMKNLRFKNFPDQPILRTKNGRPYFDKTNGLFFNGSHTKDLYITAMTEKNIAADIEQCRKKSFHMIAFHGFSKTEQVWLKKSKEIEKDFFLLWTIKEADIKFKGGSVFSLKNAVQINPAAKKNKARIVSGIKQHFKNYEHSIFSFFIKKTSSEKTLYFVSSLIIAGQDTDIEFDWHYCTEQNNSITIDKIFNYPVQKALQEAKK